MVAHRKVPRCAVLVPKDFDPLIALGHTEEVALDVSLTLPGSDTHTQICILDFFFHPVIKSLVSRV